jgi:hypothetical protein
MMAFGALMMCLTPLLLVALIAVPVAALVFLLAGRKG